MAQALSADIERLMSDLQSEDIAIRTVATNKLGQLDLSSEQIVSTLERVATSDSNIYVAKAARDALRAPIHQDMLKQLGRQQLAPPAIEAYTLAEEMPLAETKVEAREAGQKNMLYGVLEASSLQRQPILKPPQVVAALISSPGEPFCLGRSNSYKVSFSI